ncbi:MAG: hypothetical protein D8B52_06795 [Prevotella sp.]|nr:MAG: hypothetical protein D8B52_06795 [Prevotella sp.]
MPIAHIDLFPNALFSLFTLSLRGTSPPNLPFTKGRNVLSFSFTTIEFSLDISFRVLMQHTSPLEKGRKRGDYLYRTDVYFKSERGCNSKKVVAKSTRNASLAASKPLLLPLLLISNSRSFTIFAPKLRICKINFPEPDC